MKIIENGKAGEVYNVGSNGEKTNIEVAKALLNNYGKTTSTIELVPNRQSNDRRYAINYDKISRELGYKPKFTFENSLSQIISWYKKNL